MVWGMKRTLCTILTCSALNNFILLNESLDESEVVLEDMDDGLLCQNDEREAISGLEKRREIMQLLM